MLFRRSGHTVRDLVGTGLVAGLVSILSFFPALLLIVASNLLPADLIKSNTLQSISHVNYTYNSTFPRLRLDHWTECIFVTVGMRSKSLTDRSDTSFKRAFVDAVASPTLGNCTSEMPRNYFRYWHGAQIIAKPVLLVSDVSTLRIIVFLAFSCSFVLFILSIGSRVSWLTATIVGTTIVLAPLYSQLLLVPHSSAWIIGFVVATLILRDKNLRFHTNIWRLAIAGVLVAYFDLLNNPIVAPTAALFAITLARWRDGMGADFSEAALALVAWFVGYGGFWFLKWLAAGAVLGVVPVFKDVILNVYSRSMGVIGWVEVSLSNSLGRNFSFMDDVWPVSILMSLAIAVLSLRQKYRDSVLRAAASWKLALQMLAVGLIPIAWIAILQNHSVGHAWFVAPILCWTLLSIPVAMQILLLAPSATRSKRSLQMPA